MAEKKQKKSEPQEAENKEVKDTKLDGEEETVNETPQNDELEALKKENDDLKNKLLRSMAEFDNYKKRTVREKEDLTVFVKSSCAQSIITLVDNFERALECECSDESFKKGIEMLFSQFNDTLKQLGVEEIEALNKPFDPELHCAVNTVSDDSFDKNTVCQVFQKGYKIGDKIVRHAMVVVANP